MRRKLCLLVCCGVILWLFAGVASAELSLTLSSHKSSFALGEPIIVDVELKCLGGTARVLGELDPKYHTLIFFVRGPAGGEEAFIPLVLAEALGTETTLGPGESLKESAKLFFGGRGWTFPSPGNYQIRAVFEGVIGAPGPLSSNVLALEVRAPANTAEQEQARLIMGREQGKFLIYEGGDHLTQGIQALRALVSRYPRSPHAAYANFALGMAYSKPFKNFKTGVLRPANPVLARNYLNKVRVGLIAPSLRMRLQQLAPLLNLNLRLPR